MQDSTRTITLLTACQALLYVNTAVVATVNGLAGYALASDKALATAPITSCLVGSMLAAAPISRFMKRHGRVAGFSLGALCAIIGGLMCASAMVIGDFWLLCAGGFVLGANFAAAQQYRFAAAEAVAPERKSRAISIVLAGGIVGGFLGPQIAKAGHAAIGTAPYAGAYVALAAVALLTLLLLRALRIAPLTAEQRQESGRSLADIARQPAFIVAVLCCAVSYGVMNLLMAATPLAMIACDHSFGSAAFVMQWHLVAMFAPSLFTGSLIARIGLLPMMSLGVALLIGCMGVALSGVSVPQFWTALVLLGVGWNFLFVGATALLTETHAPSERATVQGFNDTVVFAVMAISSLSSGALFTYTGWAVINAVALPVAACAGLALAWLAVSRKKALAA